MAHILDRSFPLPQSSHTLFCNPPWIYLIHTFYPPYQAPHPFHTVLTSPSKAHINHIRTPNIEPSALALSARRAQLGWRHRSILTPLDSSHNTHRTVHPAFTLRGVPPPLKRIQHSRSLSDLLVFRPSLFGARRGRVKEAEERDAFERTMVNQEGRGGERCANAGCTPSGHRCT